MLSQIFVLFVNLPRNLDATGFFGGFIVALALGVVLVHVHVHRYSESKGGLPLPPKFVLVPTLILPVGTNLAFGKEIISSQQSSNISKT